MPRTVGGITVHDLSTDQLRKLIDAIGNGTDFPKMTDDPVVNFAVDCVVNDDNQPTYDGSYEGEVELFKRRNTATPHV